jgi:hypothetical protein
MQIAIRYVNFPKPGGKYGSLKLMDGTMIMVPPDLLGQFRAGVACEITTKQQTWGDSPVTIATSGPLQGPTGPVQGQQGYGGYQGPVSRETSQRPNMGFQPRVIQGGGNPNAKSPDEARMIFVTGVVGRAMGSGKFAASEIPVLAQAAAEAFDRLVSGPGKAPATEEDRRFGQPHYGHQEAPPTEPGDPGPQEPM